MLFLVNFAIAQTPLPVMVGNGQEISIKIKNKVICRVTSDMVEQVKGKVTMINEHEYTFKHKKNVYSFKRFEHAVLLYVNEKIHSVQLFNPQPKEKTKE